MKIVQSEKVKEKRVIPKKLEQSIRSITRQAIEQVLMKEFEKRQNNEQSDKIMLEKEYEQVEQPSMLESSAKSNKKLKFKNKMALVQKQELIVKAKKGQVLDLVWTVENKSKRNWPTFPKVKNFAGDFSMPEKFVSHILKPDEAYNLEYKV